VPSRLAAQAARLRGIQKSQSEQRII